MGLSARKIRGDVVGYALRRLASGIVLEEVLAADSLTQLVERRADVRLSRQ